MGQTVKNIQCRSKEHQRDTQIEYTERSAVAEHLQQDGNHHINYDNVKLTISPDHNCTIPSETNPKITENYEKSIILTE